jgi:hypothetical protein
MFHGWENFYLMVGSAAGALIGLLFVVVTLTAGRERSAALRGVSLYMTPTVLHFVMVMSISAVAMAPKLPIRLVAALVGLGLAVGLGNSVWAGRGINKLRSRDEAIHWSDFWMYSCTPSLVYLALGVADVGLWSAADWAPRVLAAVLLALLLCGIRNAWDLVTWIAPGRADPAVAVPPGSPDFSRLDKPEPKLRARKRKPA